MEDFTLTFTGSVPATDTDQVFDVELLLMGDGGLDLGETSIQVVVPAASSTGARKPSPTR